MGLSHAAAAEQAQRLSLPAAQSQAPPEKGHGRGKFVFHERGGSPELRGVPLIGTGAGAVKGTMPKAGCSAQALADEARHQAQHDRLVGRLDPVWSSRLVVRERVSANGVLRVTRSIR